MKSVRACLTALLAAGALAVAITPASADPPKSAIPACLRVQTTSRWVPYGYNHIVILENGCSKAATCTVSTDVNPQPQTAEVPSQQTVEVLTFMASASSTFVAKVTCTLH